jgi:Alpha/beta hydrolase domain
MKFRHASLCVAQAITLAILLPTMGTHEMALASTSSVPTPTVSQPPPGTRGHPFPDTLENLGQAGYVQEEVFIEGTARSFVPVSPMNEIADGRWNATPTGPAANYKIRLLIRRPSDAVKFNGTVLVEWLNVSAGFDSDTFDGFGQSFMRAGYAYVGVSAQAAGVNHLRDKWDPSRYSSLVHPGDSYSYDIFSQAAQSLRAGSPAPLGNLTNRIKSLIAWGGSQSGARLFTYINSVHPTAAVIAGFVPFIATSGAPLSQAPLPVVQMPTGARAVIRTDSATPVLFELSESEFINAARGIHSQADSEHFRLWEYAGTSHANRIGVDYTMRRLQANGIPTGVFPPCGDPPINDLSDFPVWHALLNAMHVWLQQGKAPRSAPRVELSIPADVAQQASVVRDPGTGLAKGGIRLPDIAVPTRTLTGTRPAFALKQHPNCALFGAVDPWNGDSDPWDADPALDISPKPEPKLAALYGSNASYVKAIKHSADALVAAGFLLESDVQEIVDAAKKVTIQ